MSSDCCERYKKGKKPCDDCPEMEKLSKKERKKLLHKFSKKKKSRTR